MRKILFKDNFVDVNEEFLEELKGSFREALGAYKTRLIDAENLACSFKSKIEKKQIINLIIEMLAKRSTVGTEELEGYKTDIEKIEENLKENKLSITDESNVTLDILKAYLEYELPEDILTKEEIANIHFILFKSNKTKYKSGKFRKSGDNNVMNQSAQKEFIDSKFVDKYMNKFIIYYNSLNKLDTITKAAMIHGILVGIHPFKDGNGRTTRFITDKFISKELGIPIYLSEAINLNSNNNEYGMALDQFHLENNSLHLIRFFYEIAIKQLNMNKKLIEDWMKSILSTSSTLIKKGVGEKYLNDLSIYLTDKRFIYQKELANELNISLITAGTIINSLESKGIIGESKAQGRIVLYRVMI